ncbi:putative sulfate exporter family transporter [Nanchangia anserum]|uniref:Putative sulfate exporter family transporter n=1 Tax=Nanchangia anserum TaxID=2692125 RepID=A0A8I0G8I6_9ACTO|nr:putative sulfate exporter family transporter [Nanchangia anserum]QOX82544.1 putative sulfate exporter family transporter [Nanchangia anserum]
MFSRVPQLAPGVVLSCVIAAIAYAINLAVPLVSALLCAIILGVVVRNVGLIPSRAEAGVKFSSKTILRIGVVLLGLRLSIPQVMELGVGPIVVIIATVVLTFLITRALGRLLKVAHTTSLLTATGTAICGAAAVAGMSAVVRRTDDYDPHAHDEDIEDAAATAIASVTIFGTIAMLVVPWLCTVMGLSTQAAGVWIGASIHEVGQVVAAAGFISPEVTDVATVTKLGRVVLLAPLVAIMGFLEGRASTARYAASLEAREVEQVLEGEPVDHDRAAKVHPPIMPLFVVGFLICVVIRSLIGSPETLMPFFNGADTVATLLLTIAMGAMGAGVNLKTIVTTGARALLLGVIACVVAGATSLALTLAFVD